MSDEIKEWQHTIDEIDALYSGLELRSLSLPVFSLAPLGIYIWALIKFEICLFLDFICLIPMNLVILVRNFFPGRWKHRSFSGRYFRRIFRWISNGEIPIVAFVAIRSLTGSLLRNHFRRRLGTLRRRILLEHRLAEVERTNLVDGLDKLLLRWPAWKLPQILLNYALPLLSPAVGIYQIYVPGTPGPWSKFLIMFSLAYALGFLASAFMIKRGLMLGGEGRSAYFPGFIEGSGAYAKERQILEVTGIVEKEFPLGFALSLLLVVLGILQTLAMYDTGFYQALAGEAALSKGYYLVSSMSGSVLLVLIGVCSIVRRKTLGRS